MIEVEAIGIQIGPGDLQTDSRANGVTVANIAFAISYARSWVSCCRSSRASLQAQRSTAKSSSAEHKKWSSLKCYLLV